MICRTSISLKKRSWAAHMSKTITKGRKGVLAMYCDVDAIPRAKDWLDVHDRQKRFTRLCPRWAEIVGSGLLEQNNAGMLNSC